MQEQNFEKQVQQKMDELSFTPSVPVWQNIEQQIRKKKDRRRILLFWLFPLLLVGGGTLLWINFTNTSKKYSFVEQNSNTSVKSLEHKSAKENDKDTVISLPANQLKKEKEINTSPSSEHTFITSSIKNKTGRVKNSSKPTNATTKQLSKEQTLTLNETNTETKKTFIRKKQSGTPSFIQPLTEIKESITTVNGIEDTLTIAQNLVHSPDQTTVKDSTTSTLSLKTEDVISPIDSIQTKKTQPKIHKWSWVVQSTYGISTAQTKLLKSAKTAARAAEQTFATQAANRPPSSLSPSALERGHAFSFNLGAKKMLTKRFTLTTGLGYSFFSTKNDVGLSVNKDTVLQFSDRKATVSHYYRHGETREYQNKYHFIELPVGIEWQLHSKLPLQLHTGLSFSYLIKTNALVYDPNASIYYQSKDLFSKTQLHLNTGFTYRIWHSHRKSIHMGPYMQYGITGLQKDKESNNYHLFAAGLKSQFSF